MFDGLKKWWNTPLKRKDDTNPKISIRIEAPKDKISNCYSILWQRGFEKKGEFLTSNLGGDHFLVEITEYEIYIEYLTVPEYENVKKVWRKGYAHV